MLPSPQLVTAPQRRDPRWRFDPEMDRDLPDRCAGFDERNGFRSQQFENPAPFPQMFARGVDDTEAVFVAIKCISDRRRRACDRLTSKDMFDHESAVAMILSLQPAWPAQRFAGCYRICPATLTNFACGRRRERVPALGAAAANIRDESPRLLAFATEREVANE